MARSKPKIAVELMEAAVKVRMGEYALTLALSAPPPDEEDAPDFLIALDDIAFWDPPHQDVEIELDWIGPICEAIERRFDDHGASVEFE